MKQISQKDADIFIQTLLRSSGPSNVMQDTVEVFKKFYDGLPPAPITSEVTTP